MGHQLVIASIERAGDHAMVLGIAAVIAAVGALVYGLVRLVGRSHARRTRADRAADSARGPEA